MTHKHEGFWTNGKCSVCGVECSHESWISVTGTCLNCSYKCPHTNWSSINDTICRCNVCEQSRDHSGSPATCAHKAVCERCEEEYGEINPSQHEYEYTEWKSEGMDDHIRDKVDICGSTERETERRSHTFNTSTHKCTECGYACTHPSNPDDCSICGYKKPVAPAQTETEETKKDDAVTVAASVAEATTTVSADTVTLTPAIENALVQASVNDTAAPVVIDMTVASEIPVTLVEKIAESEATVNLTLDTGVVLGLTSDTLDGTTAAPIVVKTVEPKMVVNLLTTTTNVPADKKLVVMNPVKGATTSNTAVIYQFYGPEAAGQVVNFYAADATGKFGVLATSVVFPNGYAAFVVPVVGFVGYAQ